MKRNVQKEELIAALESSWSKETSNSPAEWSVDWPARGQCVVSSLIVQEYLGGELQKLTSIFNGQLEAHYRNILPDGTLLDTTISQYPADQELTIVEVALKGFPSVRAKRLHDPDTFRRYKLLKDKVAAQLIAK